MPDIRLNSKNFRKVSWHILSFLVTENRAIAVSIPSEPSVYDAIPILRGVLRRSESINQGCAVQDVYLGQFTNEFFHEILLIIEAKFG